MKSKESIQEKYLSEIKQIISQVNKVESVAGLMMYQDDIQRLYNKFVFLKEVYASPKTEKSISKNREKTSTRTQKTLKTENRKNKKLDFDFSISEETKYPPLQIDVNDNIGFLQMLFKSQNQEYSQFIEDINKRNLEASESLIMHYQERLKWEKKEQEFIDRLLVLNKNRFK